MPRRLLVGLGFALACVWLATPSQGQPPGSVDDVTYRDANGKVIDFTGETKESAAGVKLVVGGKDKDVISPAAIIKLEPKTLPGVDAAALSLARNLEKGTDLNKALAEYAKVSKTAAAAPERSKRYLAYKEATLLVKFADQKSGDDFKTEATKAVVKMASFARANKKSWEVWPAARTAARIYTELGQYSDAAATLEDLASIKELPAELVNEAKLAQVTAVIRAKQGLAADGILNALDKDASLSAALKDRVNVLKVCSKGNYSAAAPMKPTEQIQAIDAAIAATKDPVARAIGFNFLGDLYRTNNLNRDAMWSYLWTDTVYNNEKDEQLYALSRLAALAEQAGDADRAGFFRERMLKAR